MNAFFFLLKHSMIDFDFDGITTKNVCKILCKKSNKFNFDGHFNFIGKLNFGVVMKLDVWSSVQCNFHILVSSFIFCLNLRAEDIFGSFTWKIKTILTLHWWCDFYCDHGTVAPFFTVEKHANTFNFQLFWHPSISKSMRALNRNLKQWKYSGCQ